MLNMAWKMRIGESLDPVYAAESIELLVGFMKILLWRTNPGRRTMPENTTDRNKKRETDDPATLGGRTMIGKHLKTLRTLRSRG